jgi:hypothetical protein
MLLGTFHFQDAGLDVRKPQFDVDILSDRRQREVAELLDRLAPFRPTLIAVEARPERQQAMDQDYHQFIQGEFKLSGWETHQLGFRLARRLGLDRVHSVDAWGRYYDPPLDLERYARGRTTRELGEYLSEKFDFDPWRDLAAYAREREQEHLLTEWEDHFRQRYERGDREKAQRSLRETLLGLNSEETLLLNHGEYLVNHFKVGTGNNYLGADLVTAWYSRNLRIFANLQRITGPGDRLLLIIGAGHVPILRHCAQASPEYEFIEVYEYLG